MRCDFNFIIEFLLFYLGRKGERRRKGFSPLSSSPLLPFPSMKSRLPIAIHIASIAVLLFLHIPFLLIVLYAFNTEEAAFTFPPPGLTTKWFAEAWNRPDLWQALWLSTELGSLLPF